MQAKQRVRVTTASGKVLEETCKVVGGKVMVRGQALKLDAAKVKDVAVETKDGNRVSSQACRIGKTGVVLVGAGSESSSATQAGGALDALAPVPSTTARQAAIPAFGAAVKSKKPGPYDTRTQASLAKNDERKGWELRLRRGDQLSKEQLAELHLTGWRWYGGRLQAFCLGEKRVSREALTVAQGLVTGFNSGVLATAAELAAFAAAVSNGSGMLLDADVQ